MELINGIRTNGFKLLQNPSIILALSTAYGRILNCCSTVHINIYKPSYPKSKILKGSDPHFYLLVLASGGDTSLIRMKPSRNYSYSSALDQIQIITNSLCSGLASCM